MINPSSEELVCPFRLQTPDVSIYLGDLVDSSAVYDSFTSASKVWKNVGKLVAIESMSEELDGKLCILTFVRPPDELEVAFEETKTFTDRNHWWPRLECCSETDNRYRSRKASTQKSSNSSKG